MRIVLTWLLAALGVVWAASASTQGRAIDESDELYQYGLREARKICSAVTSEVRDRWVEYGDFRFYRISFSVGEPVESYGCTIGATQIYTGTFREARAYIRRREGAQRFSYQLGADIEIFPGCRLETTLDCMKEQEGRR